MRTAHKQNCRIARLGFVAGVIVFATLFKTPCRLAGAELTPAQIQGRELAAELCDQRPTADYSSGGVLKTRDNSGRTREILVEFQILAGETTWQGIYIATLFTNAMPAIEKLTVVHGGQQPNQYRLERRDPANDATNIVSFDGYEAMTPFAGTDFWVADLGLEFFHWPEQKLIKKEMRKGRSCKVLESAAPVQAGPGYSRVISWIDSETSGLLLAEAYDAKNKLLKEFRVRSFKKVNGRWQLKEMEISNVQADSRTRLEFDLEVQ